MGSDAPLHLLKYLLIPVYFFLCSWNAPLSGSSMGKLRFFIPSKMHRLEVVVRIVLKKVNSTQASFSTTTSHIKEYKKNCLI
jgi:hypothetical protein